MNHDYDDLMDVDAVQKTLNKSRASIYRYTNTDPHDPDNLNLDYDPNRLNPEIRQYRRDPLRFHVNEVARFARDVLGLREVTIQIQESAQTRTNELLEEILRELQTIRLYLEER